MEDHAITYENLVLSTYETEHILSLSLQKETNHHASLHLIAVLSEERADEYIYTTGAMTAITLGYRNHESNIELLFRGSVVNIQVTRNGDVFHMELFALGNTCIMDIVKCSRSFQNIEMTTHQLISEIMKTYTVSDFRLEIPDEPIGKLVVQYRETDWEFLKRFVSRYGAVMIPDVKAEGIAYYVGVPKQGDTFKADDFHYTMIKSMDEYLSMKENRWGDVKEIDFIQFVIKDPRAFQLGEHIVLGDKSLHIEKAQHTLSDGILNNTYVLRRKDGFRSLGFYNAELVGASITGVVVNVARDKVMVDLEIDGAGRAVYWFPYSTMSASPDGSGWYCMPEKGDQIRVYFPTGDESEAYAVSSVSSYQPKPGESKDSMGNPNVKYLKTANDQVIQFAEDGIVINSGSGQATIFLGNSGKVSLYGNSNVNVTAEDTLSLIAKNQLLLGAQNSVTLKNEKAEIILKENGNIHVKGTKIYSN